MQLVCKAKHDKKILGGGVVLPCVEYVARCCITLGCHAIYAFCCAVWHRIGLYCNLMCYMNCIVLHCKNDEKSIECVLLCCIALEV